MRFQKFDATLGKGGVLIGEIRLHPRTCEYRVKNQHGIRLPRKVVGDENDEERSFGLVEEIAVHDVVDNVGLPRMCASRPKVARRRNVKVPGEWKPVITIGGDEDMREEREEIRPALPERGIRYGGMDHKAGKNCNHDENSRLAGHEIVNCA